MKKAFGLAVAVGLLAAAVGCGSGSTASTQVTKKDGSTASTTVDRGGTMSTASGGGDK